MEGRTPPPTLCPPPPPQLCPGFLEGQERRVSQWPRLKEGHGPEKHHRNCLWKALNLAPGWA